jgi:hypothetical protein
MNKAFSLRGQLDRNMTRARARENIECAYPSLTEEKYGASASKFVIAPGPDQLEAHFRTHHLGRSPALYAYL